MQDCPRCGGTGKLRTQTEDKRVGGQLRKLREARPISLRGMAKLLGVSPTYLSRVERGQERWTAALEKAYREAVERAL